MTSAKVSDDTVGAVVKAVFDNIGKFCSLHPALRRLSKAEMVVNGLSAPLHPGAIRYYKANGIM
ncbi:MAG: TAXI family TRAP transporter solute-binding subunit [Rhodospirillaceae bacterium]